MSAANLVAYMSDDSAQQESLTFSQVQPGTATAAQTIHVWNEKGSTLAETATEIVLSTLAKNPGDTDYNIEALAAAQRWIELRLVGVTGSGIVAQLTDWTPVGANRGLSLNAIPSNTARYVEVRAKVPPGLGAAQDIDIIVTIDWARPSRPVSEGVSEVYGDGVMLGLGDGTRSFIVSGGVLTESGTPDEFVNFTDLVWIHGGVLKVLLADAYELDANDSAAAALTAGNAYWGTLYLNESGDIEIEKSAQAASPLSVSTRPAVPAGGILLGYVQRDEDAAIANADIFQDAVTRGLFSFSSSGLVVMLGPGQAVVDNSKLRFDSTQTITLTASATCSIWLTSGGALDHTTDGSRPDTEPRALLLWEAVTDGSGVTSYKDKRRWIGGRIVPITMQFVSEVNLNDFSLIAHYPSNRPGQILPVNPVVADIDDDGTSAASGSWKFDIFKSIDGAAEATIFTSSGTTDRRSVIAWNDTTLRDTDAVPEVVDIEAYTRFRAKLVGEPGSITVGPAGARVTLLVMEA